MTSETVNLGGFVSASTVDWPGRCVCTLFLRGCPLRCWYCQNEKIRSGSNHVPIREVKEKIIKSKPIASAVVFSGGEPCYQRDSIIDLVGYCKNSDMDTCIHTSGFYPEVIKDLVEIGLKKVSLDIKSSPENYNAITNNSLACRRAYKSLELCRELYDCGKLKELDVVTTVFSFNIYDIDCISDIVGDLPYVIQQGVVGGKPDLDIKIIAEVAGCLKRKIRIRSGLYGELTL